MKSEVLLGNRRIGVSSHYMSVGFQTNVKNGVFCTLPNLLQQRSSRERQQVHQQEEIRIFYPYRKISARIRCNTRTSYLLERGHAVCALEDHRRAHGLAKFPRSGPVVRVGGGGGGGRLWFCGLPGLLEVVRPLTSLAGSVERERSLRGGERERETPNFSIGAGGLCPQADPPTSLPLCVTKSRPMSA